MPSLADPFGHHDVRFTSAVGVGYHAYYGKAHLLIEGIGMTVQILNRSQVLAEILIEVAVA